MKPLPHFVQSPLLASVPWVYHAFLGVDPVEGRGRRERLVEDLAVAHDPDLADVLVRDEDRAVGRERHVHGEAEPIRLELEPLLGVRPGGGEDNEDGESEAESADRGASVGGAPG